MMLNININGALNMFDYSLEIKQQFIYDTILRRDEPRLHVIRNVSTCFADITYSSLRTCRLSPAFMTLRFKDGCMCVVTPGLVCLENTPGAAVEERMSQDVT